MNRADFEIKTIALETWDKPCAIVIAAFIWNLRSFLLARLHCSNTAQSVCQSSHLVDQAVASIKNRHEEIIYPVSVSLAS